jgi:hypothetical protein
MNIFGFISSVHPVKFGYHAPNTLMLVELYREISSNRGHSIFMSGNAAWQHKNQRSSGLRSMVTGAPVATKATPRPAEQEMTPVAPTSAHPLIDAIQDRWSLFTDADLQEVRTREELIAAVQARYRITEDQATAQVLEWVARNARS